MKKKNETVSCECKSCDCDFLAITGTKEFNLKICYRCFLNGLAESYLARMNVYYCKSCENEFAINKDKEAVCCLHCKSQDIENN